MSDTISISSSAKIVFKLKTKEVSNNKNLSSDVKSEMIDPTLEKRNNTSIDARNLLNEVIDIEFANSILNIRQTAKAVTSDASDNSLKNAVAALETRMITKAISTYGSKRKAAVALGIDHSTLVKKCQRYGI